MIIPAKRLHVHAQSKIRYLSCLTIWVVLQSLVTWGHKIVERGWEEGEGGVAEGDDRDMGNGRTGMN